VTSVIGAVSIDVAYAISTIFLFNIAAALVFPLLGHLLGLSQHAFGLFAGTAVNDVLGRRDGHDLRGRRHQLRRRHQTGSNPDDLPITLALAAWAGHRIASLA
jgi:membrane associated rhomboid family serine protease